MLYWIAIDTCAKFRSVKKKQFLRNLRFELKMPLRKKNQKMFNYSVKTIKAIETHLFLQSSKHCTYIAI